MATKTKGRVIQGEVLDEGGDPSSTALAIRPSMNIESLMARALEHNASVETVERLVELSERMRAKWAEQQFYVALAKFQAEVPTIGRTKGVKEKTGNSIRYYYAPYEEIVKTIAKLCEELGFSHTEDTSIEPMNKEETGTWGKNKGWLVCVCSIHHVDGFTKTSTFRVPIGSEFMTMQQEFGAASTFAKRYALLNGFGLATGGADTDGRMPGGDRPRGGQDHRFQTGGAGPQSKSERRATASPEEPDEPAGRPDGYDSIQKAKDDKSRITESSLKTLTSAVKRNKIPEGRFEAAFGFRLDEMDKRGLNQTVDWIQNGGK